MSTVLSAPAPTGTHRPEPARRLGAELRRSAIGFVATALSLVALLAVVRDGQWLARSLFLAAGLFVVGSAGRALRLPRPAVVVVQAIAALFAVLALQVSDWAPRGFLPGASALRHLGHQIDDGTGDFTNMATPDHATFGIVAIILIAASVAAIAVDALAVGYRRPDLAAWVIPVLYAVPAAALAQSWRELMFLLPALGYLMLLVEGTGDRAARWGDSTIVESGGNRRMTAVAGSGVLVLCVLVPLALQGVTGNLLRNYGVGPAPAPLQIRDPLSVMRTLLVAPAEKPMFLHHSDSPWPAEEYLESAILDSFDGSEWRGGVRSVADLKGVLPAPFGLSASIPVTPVNAAMQARPDIDSDFLPTPRPATHVDVRGQWKLDAATGDILSGDGRDQIAEKSWSTVGLVLDPDPAQLTGAEPKDPTLARFLLLPGLPPQIAAQAKQITAGAKDVLEAGMKLQEFFRDPARFTYDLHPHGSGTAAITAFLSSHHGYSEQAAATMAVMARTLGIPARLAVGFTPGKQDGPDGWTVTNYDAHTWPELFLPDVGWTRFEPTPGTAGSQPRPLHWLTPAKKTPPSKDQKHKNDQPPPPPQDQPQSAPPPPPAQSAGGNNSCALDPTNCTHKLNPPPSGQQFPWWIVWPFLGLFVVSLPRLIRWFISRRRWAQVAFGHSLAWRGSPEGAAVIARVAWLELRDDAVDLGHAWPTNRTPRQAGDALAAEVALSAGTRAELEELVASVERARYAPRAGQRVQHERLRTAVLRVRREIATAASKPDRARYWLAPRSLRFQIRPMRERLAAMATFRPRLPKQRLSKPRLPKPRLRRRSAN
jgi:hypothetical protein